MYRTVYNKNVGSNKAHGVLHMEIHLQCYLLWSCMFGACFQVKSSRPSKPLDILRSHTYVYTQDHSRV